MVAPKIEQWHEPPTSNCAFKIFLWSKTSLTLVDFHCVFIINILNITVIDLSFILKFLSDVVYTELPPHIGPSGLHRAFPSS